MALCMAGIGLPPKRCAYLLPAPFYLLDPFCVHAAELSGAPPRCVSGVVSFDPERDRCRTQVTIARQRVRRRGASFSFSARSAVNTMSIGVSAMSVPAFCSQAALRDIGQGPAWA